MATPRILLRPVRSSSALVLGCLATALTSLCVATPAWSQGASAGAPAQTITPAGPISDFAAVQRAKVYRATRTAEPIVIDGRADEPAWNAAEIGGDFYQTDPLNGVPATESTTFRILYDDSNIYVAVVAQQSAPFLVSDLKRDFEGSDGDQVVLFFDTFHDKRNGFAFHTNPGGAMRDQQIAESIANANWDGIFEVVSRVEGPIWTAEFVIPFKTLRFDDKESSQTWGFNLQRIMRGKNEWVQWSPAPRPFRVFEGSIAGTLVGIDSIRQGMNLNVKPYVVANTQPGEVQRLAGRKAVDAGVDVKYGVTSRLTLDVTVNTDFSQVEADEQQVNLTRFGLFFPEQRVFFLENLGLFDLCGNATGAVGGGGGGSGSAAATGAPGGGLNNNGRCGGERDIVPFYSRRIGLSGDGQPLAIHAGARLTGKVAGLDVGLLHMNVGSSSDQPSDNWTVARVRKDVLAHSQIGGLVFNRQGASGDWNRSAAIDGNFNFLQQRLNLSGFAMRADTPQRRSNNLATSAQVTYRDRLVSAVSGYTGIDADYHNDFGFVPRTGIRKYVNNVGLSPRFRSGPVLESNPRVQLRQTTDMNNRLVSGFNAVGQMATFRDGATVTLYRNFLYERLDQPFLLQGRILIPAGEYPWRDWNIRYAGSRARRFSVNGGFRFGGFYGGTKQEVSAGTAIRYSSQLQTNVTWTRNYIDLPEGQLTTDLIAMRADASFSPKMFLQSFVQYNTAAKTVQANLRYRFIHHPLSDLFLLYTEVRGIDGSSVDNRILSLKFTHLLNF